MRSDNPIHKLEIFQVIFSTDRMSFLIFAGSAQLN